MRRALVFMIIFSFVANTGFATIGGERVAQMTNNVADQLWDKLKAKDVDSLLNLMKNELGEKNFKFLAQKAAGLDQESKRLKATRKSKLSFAIESNKTIVNFEIIEPTGSAFLINNKSWSYDPEKPIEQAWDELMKLLPGNSLGNVVSRLILPQANAGGLLTGLALVVISAVLCVDIVATKNLCEDFKKADNQCSKEKLTTKGWGDNLLYPESMQKRDWPRMKMAQLKCKDTIKQFRTCMKALIERQIESNRDQSGRIAIPKKIAEYYNNVLKDYPSIQKPATETELAR